MQRTAGVVGVVTLRDPALGDAVLAMRNDGTCTRLQLFPHAASIPEEACLSGGARVQAHHEVALKGLAHHRDTAYHVDNMAWAQSKARLESATPYDVLPAFEQALASLAGPGSTLRRWGELVQETATRLERVEKQASSQPASEAAVLQELQSAEARIQMLQHKAQFAATLQHNLELRAQALRSVLRTPTLWPCGDISEDEQRHHRHLLALRDRILESQRTLQRLVSSAVARGEGPSIADRVPCGIPDLAPGARAEVDDGDLEEERVELMRQDSILQKLVLSLKQALQQGEQVLAQGTEGARHRGL